MARRGNERRHRPARAFGATLAAVAAAMLAEGPAAAQEPPLRSSLQRLVHHFDFEDAEALPLEMPRYVRRVDGDEQRRSGSFRRIPFGRIALSRAQAHGGRWSLGFEPDGDSLVAEVVSGVLPVMPGSAYEVTVAVRTEGLVRSRARLSAWLHDSALDRPVAGSRVSSPAARSEGGWRTLSVRVPATAADAADLIVELEVLQPRDLLGAAAPESTPLFDDLEGAAFFDDLQVWLVPRIDLATGVPGNVFVAPGRPRLEVRIADLMEASPPTELRVLDAAGRAVHATRLQTTGRLREEPVELPALPLGWYRTEVWIPGADPAGTGIVGRAALDFVVAAPPAASRPDGPRLGLLIGAPTEHAAPLMEVLGIEDALVPLTGGQRLGDDARRDELVSAVEQLARRGRLVLAVDPQAAEAVADTARTLAIRLGPRLGGWQLGTTDVLRSRPVGGTVSRTLAASMGLASAGGATMVPWPVEMPVDLPEGVRANVVVPHEVRPAAVGTALEAWPEASDVTLLSPPRGLYGARDRVADLVRRTLHAWRAGAGRLYVEAPWRAAGDGASPDATFVVVQHLARHLQGRRFAGALPLDRGIEAWVLEPRDGGPASLVAWADDGPRSASLVLGDDDVRASDALGNPLTLARDGDRHVLPVDAQPIFVNGVDGALARFRVSLALVPDELPTEHRSHERELRLTNPWDVPISGTVRLRDDDQWQVTPRVSPFTIAPGASVAVPVTLIPARSMVAGTRTIEAEIELTAARRYRFRASVRLHAGLADLEMRESWRHVVDPATGRRDLIIRVDVHNVSPDPVSLVAFLQGAGIGVQHQPIGRLAPGAAATRTFTVRGDDAAPAGGRVFVGVDDQHRARRLTHELVIE